MYTVNVYTDTGVKIVLLTFSSLKDAFNYARLWCRSHKEYTHADVLIEQIGNHGSVLIGDMAAVARLLS